MKPIEKILLTAIAIERYGQDFYGRFAEVIEDKKGRALMKGLGHDEQEHEAVLSQEYQRQFKRAPPKTIDVNLGLKAVRDIFGSKKKIRKENDVLFNILETAIVVEEESIKYYSSKARNVKEKRLSGLLKNLIEIEKDHRRMLEENLLHLKQEAAWWGYVPILEG
ncbi:MAG: ferritin family protein [Thermoplasmata archaeon]